MAHCFRLKQYRVVLGKAADTDTAMALPELALPASQWLSSEAWTLGLDPLVPQCDSETEQLFALLSSLLASLQSPCAGEPVYLLLPESMADTKRLSGFTQLIRQHYPELLAHPNSRVFPFGACSALLALKTMQQCWQTDSALNPWLIAVDSPLQQFRLSFAQDLPQQADYLPVSLSEGAVAAQWSADASGLGYLFNETELTPQHAVEEQGLQALLLQISQLLQSPIATVYLPDNGNTALAEAWLSACGMLHPWLTAETSYQFLAYHTGELGSCGGLYRLLHLYLAHLRQERLGYSLQAEQALQGFRSAAVFHWHSAAIS